MIINLNEKPYEVAEGTTLDKFIESLDIQIQGIAVAVDFEVVPKSRWHETVLKDGMTLTVIHAVSGG